MPKDNWILFMDWLRMGREGNIEPTLCPNDETQLVGIPDEQGNPSLWCYYCGSTVTLGLIFFDRIRVVVEGGEHENSLYTTGNSSL